MIFFHRLDNTQIYIADESPADHGRLIYLFPKDVAPAESDLPVTVLWNDWKGYFLFLEALPPDIGPFIEKLYQALSQEINHASFGWLNGDPEGDFSVFSLEIKSDSHGRPVTLSADFTFRQLIFRIGKDEPVALDENDDFFLITNLGQRIQIISQETPFQPVNISDSLELPLKGASRGAFSAFQVSLNADQIKVDGLDAACYYFYPDKDAINGIAKMRCPTFDLSAEGGSPSLNLEGTLFPIDWDDSFFSFIIDPPQCFGSYFRTTKGHPLQLAPATSTRLIFTKRPGDKITESTYYYLAPEGDFVLQIDDAKEGDFHDLLCGLQGTEYIGFQPQTGKYPGDRLRFTSRQPAFAPNYPFTQASPIAPPPDLKAKLLDGSTYTTAWATVVRDPSSSIGSIPYVAQPKGASLYGLDNLINKKYTTLYGVKDPSVVLPNNNLTFPLVPYAGVTPDKGPDKGFSAAQIEDFECQIIGPTRRQAIGEAATNTAHSKQACLLGRTIAEDSSPYNATTPSGLIATIGTDGIWTKILLGQNLQPTLRQIYFCNPDRALQQAFQTNQLFLVVANKDHLGTLTGSGSGDCDRQATFYNQMNIEDWLFEAAVGQTNQDDPQSNKYGDYYNVIIIKGRQGKLYDPPKVGEEDTVSLVANPDKWTQRQTFSAPVTVNNDKPDLGQLVILSQWLQTYFQDARVQPDTDYFKKFNAIARDENWTGILVLRMKIADLPADLAGITAGITSPEQFNVHHFAIEIGQVEGKPGQQPTLKDTSSMFGLIYYVDPEFAPPTKEETTIEPVPPPIGVDYDFRLLSLKVLFENTSIKHFHSYAQITLNRFFDMRVTRMGQGGNSYNTIVLRGSYQNNNGRPVYSLGSTSDNTFYFDSNVVNKIEVTSAQMTTRNSGDQGTVVSWFGLSGFIDYKIIYKDIEKDGQIKKFPFDVFSFGNEEEEDHLRKGLSFSDLGLQMSFPTIAPMQREFTFVSNEIRFDLATSKPRDKSLFLNFALDIQGLVSGTQDSPPSKEGFLTVITDARLTGVDNGPWYGLRYRLNMGTPGDLAGKVSLTSYLLTAWAPDSSGEGGYKALVGLELPGTGGGAKLISLQNVLKLSIGLLRLTFDESKNSFLLMLTDIALKFLGLLKIPPSGSTLFYLFGNPTAEGQASGLGWYAMYRQKKNNTTVSKGQISNAD